VKGLSVRKMKSGNSMLENHCSWERNL